LQISELPQVHLDAPQAPPTGDTSQSTTDMFLDMFTKKGKFLSKLTSFDSEVKRIFPINIKFRYSKVEFQVVLLGYRSNPAGAINNYWNW